MTWVEALLRCRKVWVVDGSRYLETPAGEEECLLETKPFSGEGIKELVETRLSITDSVEDGLAVVEEDLEALRFVGEVNQLIYSETVGEGAVKQIRTVRDREIGKLDGR